MTVASPVSTSWPFWSITRNSIVAMLRRWLNVMIAPVALIVSPM
jgi:hypothetical protein